MTTEEKILAEIEKLTKKVDRINSMIQSIPTTHQTHLEEWLTEEQTRELLQRGATSLWGLRKTGKIKSSKIGNRTYYNRESIVEYIEKNRVK